MVIAGNIRLRAAQALGWEDVPVRLVSLSREIEAEWNLKDNDQRGEYVDDELATILAHSLTTAPLSTQWILRLPCPGNRACVRGRSSRWPGMCARRLTHLAHTAMLSVRAR